jgi:predicted dehydrogenase
MSVNCISRRRFLKGTAAGVMASPLIVSASALGKEGQLPPSERITIGIFGVGNRGSGSIQAMRPLPDHQILAIAEARRDRAERALGVVNEMYANRVNQADYKACQIYADFQEVLLRDDIDAIWCTVPDHWHGPMMSRIIKAGKDIYGEKSLTRYIAQGIELRKLVRQYGTVFQTGTQQRSDSRFRKACELARNGYLGKIHTVEVISPAGTAYPVVAPSEPPEGFDWDLWSGPAPLFPFDKQRVEWLAMYMISHYCAGFVTNWGVHHLDIAGWGVPEIFHKTFEIEGKGTMPKSGMTDTWIHWRVTLRYASGLTVDYCSQSNPHPEDGCRFIGDEGWVFVNRGKLIAQPESLLQIKFKDSDTRLHASPASNNSYTSHTADLFRSIRSRQNPVSPIEEGHAATTLGNVTDISLRLGRKLKWDPTQDLFIGDEQANQMLFRTERSPWTM